MRKPFLMIEKQEAKSDVPEQASVTAIPAVHSIPLPTENKPAENTVIPSPKRKEEKPLPVLDYLRISQYYPPDTTVEYMNDDICRHLEAAKQHRLYGY